MPAFSPLALTQVLPFLPLAQGDIDYQSERRGEPGLIDGLLLEPTTTVILVRNGLLAVPRGQGRLTERESASMRLATLPGTYAAQALAASPDAVAMFLGGYEGYRGTHVIAVDISRVPVQDVVPVPDAGGTGADDAFGRTLPHDDTAGRRSLFARTVERFDWVDLRGFVPHASAREAGQAVTAVSLGLWHATQRHCPTCGAPTEPAMAGWAQRCTSRDDGNRLLFPRVEPAVITAIVDAQDRLLLQHNRAWNDPTLYSVSAGFVEAGENLEHACRREAREEVGITLGEVRYLGSQPWPFPASLMVAFKAYALDTRIRTDGDETVDARWVSRDELTDELVRGRITMPNRAAIARYMIEEWYGRSL
ncbi:NAD(+) diphosphatase [Bifidobacterium pullorum]|uniref:NAD(+) diphosphatase n=1 Tax=Bifidobacterium pullorum TaxID=78448 RepID=UPI00242C208A|nr:NAD(+) diphosphatase [Bifidobacterium pullorum]